MWRNYPSSHKELAEALQLDLLTLEADLAKAKKQIELLVDENSLLKQSLVELRAVLAQQQFVVVELAEEGVTHFP